MKLNERIELKCSPPEGYPEPQVIWLKNGQKIIKNQLKDQSLISKRTNRSLIDQIRNRPKRINSFMNSSNRSAIKSQVNRSNEHYSKDLFFDKNINKLEQNRLEQTRFTNNGHKNDRKFKENNINESDEDHSMNEPNEEKDDSSYENDQLVQIDERFGEINHDLNKNIPYKSSSNEDQWTNFIQTPNHSLLIYSSKIDDLFGNFTCVAINASGRRYSRTIMLKGIFFFSNFLNTFDV